MRRKSNKAIKEKKPKVNVELFEAAQNKIQYIKELKQLDGIKSVNACLLMAQIEYWFAIMGNSFFKYKERPETEQYRYKEGESWTEELGISSAEFTNAFAQIGVSYNSKKVYDEAKSNGDEFQGRFYCSYHNKVSRLTYYFRNDKKVGEAIKTIRELKTQSPGDKDSKLSNSTKSNARDKENTNIEKNISSLESSDTTTDTTSDITSEREQNDSLSKKDFSFGKEIENKEEKLGIENNDSSLETTPSSNPIESDQTKVELPENFAPTWDAKYRAFLHFPDKSISWVTEKFTAHYQANGLRLPIEQWHQKWWDWMQTEREAVGSVKLDEEHNAILGYVSQDVLDCFYDMDEYLIDVSNLQKFLNNKYSKETLTDVLLRLFIVDNIGRVGNYYFNNTERNEWWTDICSEIEKRGLMDENVEIYSLPDKRKSLREIRQWNEGKRNNKENED